MSVELCHYQDLGSTILLCMAGSTACKCSGATISTSTPTNSSIACRHGPEGPTLLHCMQVKPLSGPVRSTACRHFRVAESYKAGPRYKPMTPAAGILREPVAGQ